MRFIDRLIIFIFSLCCITLAVGGVFLCFNPELGQAEILNTIAVLTAYRWFVLVGAAVLFVLGLLMMFGSAFHRKGQSKSTAISTQTQGEDVQISVGAIDCIVGQVVKGYSQVKSVSTSVAESADGIKIKAKTVVNGDINIPDLAKQLREDIKIQLETMVGLKVKEVKIVVTDVVAKPITVDKNSAARWDDVETSETSEAAENCSEEDK
ncbi:MAG: alkaline shock response membrane anchor protein AmaP [Bacillota bacterium]|jgi:uncharacterized alkaline shock family protein YloU